MLNWTIIVVAHLNSSPQVDMSLILDHYSARSFKQQSTGRHVTHLGYIILILSQPILHSGEAANTKFIVFYSLDREGENATGQRHKNNNIIKLIFFY